MINAETCLREEIGRLGLPGLAVVARQAGEEILALGFGCHDAEGRKRIGPDTMFGVASLTKLVTACTVMRLAEQRLLDVDDLVAAHFPGLEIARTAPMRLHHLLSHSAGLPGLGSRYRALNRANPRDATGGIGGPARPLRGDPAAASAPLVDVDDLIAYLNAQRIDLLGPPGAMLSYSNEGYCLLGGLIEKLSGMPYADAARQSVFAPLGMHRTTIGNAMVDTFDDVARPLIRTNGAFAQGEFWDAPLFYSAGGVVASARDLVRLIGVLDDSSELLGAASRQQLLRPRMAVPSRPNDRIGYGYGLEYQHFEPDATLLWHSGQRAGVSSFVGWVAQRKLALAVLSNVADVPVASIGHRLASILLERADIAWPPPCGEVSGESAPRGSLDRFAGNFASAEGFDARVVMRGNDLCLEKGAGRSFEVFRFAGEDSGVVAGQTFRFLPSGEREPWALALDLRVLRRERA